MTESETGCAGLAEVFRRAREERRIALIPYVCGGDPDLATSQAIVDSLGPAGADAIEVGIPYGDPLADGPTIAAAAQRALEAGTSIDDVIALVRRARASGAPPVLLFTYLNPIVQYGLPQFAAAVARAGAAGAIVADVPLEESGELRAAFAPHGLALPLLVAPTTPLERAAAIAKASDGFVYLVSRLGVTGAAYEPDIAWIAGRVAQLRQRTHRPIAVGFGISRAEHVRSVAEHADGAIIGSALVDAYAGSRGEEAVARARTFIWKLHAATPTGG